MGSQFGRPKLGQRRGSLAAGLERRRGRHLDLLSHQVLYAGVSKINTMRAKVAALTIRSILEVSLGVNHDDMSHAILERIPKWRIRERGGLVSIDLRSLASRG
jgi:hypothetical protein